MRIHLRVFKYLVLIVFIAFIAKGLEASIVYADGPQGRIAYVSNYSDAGGGLEGLSDVQKTSYDIWIMDIDLSTDIEALPAFYKVTFPESDESDEINPALNQKGDWVAFASDRDGDWNIYVFHLETEELYQITFCCEDELEPTWLLNEGLAYVSLNNRVTLNNGLLTGFGDIYLRDIWNVIDGIEDVDEKNIASGLNFSPRFSKSDTRLIYIKAPENLDFDYSDLYMFHGVREPEESRLEHIGSGYELSAMNPAWFHYGRNSDYNEFFVNKMCLETSSEMKKEFWQTHKDEISYLESSLKGLNERDKYIESDVIFFNKMFSSVEEFNNAVDKPEIYIGWRCEDPRKMDGYGEVRGELPYSKNMMVNDVSPDGDWLLVTFTDDSSPDIKGHKGGMAYYSLREFYDGKPRVMCCFTQNNDLRKASWSVSSGELPDQSSQNDIEINLFGNEVGVELELDTKSFFGGGVLDKEYERIDRELALEIERIESDISFLEFDIVDQKERIERERRDYYKQIEMDLKNREIDFQRQVSDFDREIDDMERNRTNEIKRMELDHNNSLKEIYNFINRRKQEIAYEKDDLVKEQKNQILNVSNDWKNQQIFLEGERENQLKDLEREKIEYLEYIGDFYDSEISNLNAEYLPRIENAECANPINGCSGSFIPPDQRSTKKQISVQDGSILKPDTSVWRGEHGIMRIGESDYFDIGSGRLMWSIAAGQQGYFYAGDYTNPKVEIANVFGYRKNKCRRIFDFGFRYEGYSGLSNVRDLINATALKYSIPKETVRFGTKKSDCNMGLLVFRQGEEYGVIDFKEINDYELELEYWVGDPDVTDFSDANLELGRQDAVISVPNIVSKTQFSNNYLGYEFTFPSEWDLDEWVDSNLNTYYSGNISTGRGSSMNISIKAVPRDGFSLEQHINDELSGDREDFIEYSRKSLNSLEGILLSGISPRWSIPHIREKIVFVTDNYRVVIMFMADDGIFESGDEKKSTWEDFVDSIKRISSAAGISAAQKQEIDMLKKELENRQLLLEKDRVSGKEQYTHSWEMNMEAQKANLEKDRIEFKKNWDLTIQQLKEDSELDLEAFVKVSSEEIENLENQVNDLKEIQFSEKTIMRASWDSGIDALRNRIEMDLAEFERSIESWKQSVDLDSERREMEWEYQVEQSGIDINMTIADLRDQIIILESQADIEKQRLDMKQSALVEEIANEEQNIQMLKRDSESEFRNNIEDLEKEHQRMLAELNAEQEKLILEGKLDEDEANLRRMEMEQLMKRDLGKAQADYDRQQRDIQFKESQLNRLQEQAEREDLYQEGERGFFSNPREGTLKGAGWEEKLRDPGFLAMAGIIVTVGTSLFQMVRGR